MRVCVLASEEGFVSALAAQQMVSGHALGVLEVFNPVALDPGPEWLEAFQVLGRRLVIGVDQSNLYKGLERTRVELTLRHDETVECWPRALELRDS